jgi:hypothetical protein
MQLKLADFDKILNKFASMGKRIDEKNKEGLKDIVRGGLEDIAIFEKIMKKQIEKIFIKSILKIMVKDLLDNIELNKNR